MQDQLTAHQEYYKDHINDIFLSADSRTTILSILAECHAESELFELAFELGAVMVVPGGAGCITPLHAVFEGAMTKAGGSKCTDEVGAEIVRVLQDLYDNSFLYNKGGWNEAAEIVVRGKGVPAAYLATPYFECIPMSSPYVRRLCTKAAALADDAAFVKKVIMEQSSDLLGVVIRTKIDVFALRMNGGRRLLSYMAEAAFPTEKKSGGSFSRNNPEKALACLKTLFAALIRRTSGAALKSFEDNYFESVRRLRDDYEVLKNPYVPKEPIETYHARLAEKKSGARLLIQEKQRQLAQTAALMRNVFLKASLSETQTYRVRDVIAALEGSSDTGEALAELCYDLETAAIKLSHCLQNHRKDKALVKKSFLGFKTLNNRLLTRVTSAVRDLKPAVPQGGPSRKAMKENFDQLVAAQKVLEACSLTLSNYDDREIDYDLSIADVTDILSTIPPLKKIVMRFGAPGDSVMTVTEITDALDHLVNPPFYSVVTNSP